MQILSKHNKDQDKFSLLFQSSEDVKQIWHINSHVDVPKNITNQGKIEIDQITFTGLAREKEVARFYIPMDHSLLTRKELVSFFLCV